MNITIACVGALKTSPEKDIILQYIKRFDWSVSIKEITIRKKLPSKALKEEEGKALLQIFPKEAIVILLDEKGSSLSSQQFAQKLTEFQVQGKSSFVFVIGGADGVSDMVKQQASLTLSFGHMTWPHMLVRVMIVEQLYRAQQIIKGHPYHRDG